MAPKNMKILGLALLAVLAALLAQLGSSQSTSGCTPMLMMLTPCLNYVTGNSSAPSSTCCSTLGSIVQSRPQCLCLLLNGAGSSLGYNINQTLALALPSACSVKTPSPSLCNALSPSSAPTTSTPADNNAPVAPAAASTPTIPSALAPSSPPTTSPPADSSDNTPVTPAASSTPSIPSGSKTTPAATSASGSIKASFGSLAFALLLASFGSSLLKS